jgi:hypothetical protein
VAHELRARHPGEDALVEPTVRPRRVQGRGIEESALVDAHAPEISARCSLAVQGRVQVDQERLAVLVHRSVDHGHQVEIADPGT